MKHSAKNIFLKTIVPVLFCGLTASPALAAKSVKNNYPTLIPLQLSLLDTSRQEARKTTISLAPEIIQPIAWAESHRQLKVR